MRLTFIKKKKAGAVKVKAIFNDRIKPCPVWKEVKLKNFLCLVKNKRNRQYSFILKKRALQDAGLSPDKILNIVIPREKAEPDQTNKILTK